MTTPTIAFLVDGPWDGRYVRLDRLCTHMDVEGVADGEYVLTLERAQWADLPAEHIYCWRQEAA